MLAAAQIAGLNVLSLMHDSTAFAFKYVGVGAEARARARARARAGVRLRARARLVHGSTAARPSPSSKATSSGPNP
jgi:hypothetical protein